MAKKEARWIRLYLNVRVDFTEEGMMLPRSFVWTDGETYEIDRVLDCVAAPALKAGGQGDRYKLEIRGKIRYLFFEHNSDCGSANLGRWFMEWKDETNGAA